MVFKLNSKQKARFHGCFDVSDSGCWIWNSGTKNGTPIFVADGIRSMAVKVAFAIQNKGAAPDHMSSRNKCGNKACVNPDHLLFYAKPSESPSCSLKKREDSRVFITNPVDVPNPIHKPSESKRIQFTIDPYIEKRFWKKVFKSESGCWIWTGSLANSGYGVIVQTQRSESGSSRKLLQAHRVSYMIANGPFDQKMSICHKCDNTACVNPDHLVAAPPHMNVWDMIMKGRSKIGKLSPENVIEIRRIFKEDPTRRKSEVAAMFGVTTINISQIVNGRTWRALLENPNSADEFRAMLGHKPTSPQASLPLPPL